MNTFSSKVYVPDGLALAEAMARVTHMGIGAHQDDLEIFAYHGIETCYRSEELWFAGVTVTDGGGSARVGSYRSFTDEQMKQARHDEQNAAARMGEYGLMAQLGHASRHVKSREATDVVDELEALLRGCQPDTLYLHNPADKHDTHVAVLARCLEATRRLPEGQRPRRVYGCEVWRDLDWLDDAAKVMLPVDRYPKLAEDLIRLFDSQVAGGKDYVQATLGRRRANATYFDSHSVDQAAAYTVAMDLKPLIDNPATDVADFVSSHIARFKEDAVRRLQAFG